MDQNYLNEYLASVNGDSSLTNDSKDLIQKHITGLFAFARRRDNEKQANENKPVQNQEIGQRLDQNTSTQQQPDYIQNQQRPVNRI
jgi:ribonuclease HI